MWYQKMKILSMVVFRDEGTEMLRMRSRTNPLTWQVMLVYPTRQCFLIVYH